MIVVRWSPPHTKTSATRAQHGPHGVRHRAVEPRQELDGAGGHGERAARGPRRRARGSHRWAAPPARTHAPPSCALLHASSAPRSYRRGSSRGCFTRRSRRGRFKVRVHGAAAGLGLGSDAALLSPPSSPSAPLSAARLPVSLAVSCPPPAAPPRVADVKEIARKRTPWNVLEEINESLARYGFRIQLVRSETHAGAVYAAFVNTRDDALSKEVKPCPPELYGGFKALLEALGDADAGKLRLSTALRLQADKAGACTAPCAVLVACVPRGPPAHAAHKRRLSAPLALRRSCPSPHPPPGVCRPPHTRVDGAPARAGGGPLDRDHRRVGVPW